MAFAAPAFTTAPLTAPAFTARTFTARTFTAAGFRPTFGAGRPFSLITRSTGASTFKTGNVKPGRFHFRCAHVTQRALGILQGTGFIRIGFQRIPAIVAAQSVKGSFHPRAEGIAGCSERFKGCLQRVAERKACFRFLGDRRSGGGQKQQAGKRSGK